MKGDLPSEMIYADDYDNLTTNRKQKQIFKKMVKDILGEDNLMVNEDKTEDTVLKRYKHDLKKKEKNEPWRDTVKLGSKLGDKEDKERRKNLSRGKLIQIQKILKLKNVVSIEKKMKMYNAMVKSVLNYNSCSFHGQQLRKVIGVVYPQKIRNKKWYKLTQSRPISIDITRARWKMFGHALRQDGYKVVRPG